MAYSLELLSLAISLLCWGDGEEGQLEWSNSIEHFKNQPTIFCIPTSMKYIYSILTYYRLQIYGIQYVFIQKTSLPFVTLHQDLDVLLQEDVVWFLLILPFLSFDPVHPLPFLFPCLVIASAEHFPWNIQHIHFDLEIHTIPSTFINICQKKNESNSIQNLD